ncbi:FtsX-like permease family protein [bacterium]|nr:FtsX-like permease family protein [bacterium]
MLIQALWLVVVRSLQQHRVAGWITTFSIALATALLLTISSLQFQATRVFVGQSGGFDAVLGARGSPLQLVLSTLYHMESSPGNLAWNSYLTLKKDPQVAAAVPVALGDNYLGFRIVGTSSEFFSDWGAGLEFATGTPFSMNKPQAVVGSWAAQKTGLRLGDTFHPYHGLNYDAGAQHSESYQVVGILKPTNSPQDRAIWIPLEGVYRMSGHVLRGRGTEFTPRPGEAIPEEHQELSGVLVKFKSPQIGMQFEQSINREGKVATLAWPVSRVIFELFEKLGWVIQLLQLITLLVLLVAAASVTASLCNTLHERRRDFAILRALGAGRGFVSGVVIAESTWLSVLGALWGLLIHFALLAAVSQWLRARTGIQFEVLASHPGLLLSPLLVVTLGLASGLLPMLMVYRGSVAPDLT